jgi:hypothetical protein
MNAGRIARVSGNFAACVGSLSGLSASEFGPTRSSIGSLFCKMVVLSTGSSGARRVPKRDGKLSLRSERAGRSSPSTKGATTSPPLSRLDYLQLVNYERIHYSGSTGDHPGSRFRLPSDQSCRNHAAARLDPTFEVSCRRRFVRRFILPTALDAGLSGCCSEHRASRAAIMAKTSAL